MNKFILALVLVATAVALAAGSPVPDLDSEQSEFSLSPPDEEETDGLKGTNLEGFRDFCIRSRDHVVGDMRNRGNIFASGVFASIFRSFGEVAQSGLNANTKATDRLSKQLINPSAPIDESSEDQVDKIIAEGQKAIQQAEKQPQGLFAAFMGGIKSFGAAGYGDAIAKIMELKNELGAKSISENLVGFCEQLSTYEKEAVNIFDDVKSSLVAEDAEQYSKIKYNQVAPKCITSNRLTRADGFCKFVLAVKDSLSKILGFELPANNSEQ